MASMTANYDVTAGEKITFLYKVDNLFNQAMIYSSYKAESIKTEAGGTMLEEYAITQDEKQLFLVMLEEALHDCGMRFRKLSHGLTTDGGIFFNVTPPEATDTDKYCGFRINDQENYNENMLDYVAKHAESYIVNYILYKWYNTRNLSNLAQSTNMDMKLSRHNLEQSLFQFYKPMINP